MRFQLLLTCYTYASLTRQPELIFACLLTPRCINTLRKQSTKVNYLEPCALAFLSRCQGHTSYLTRQFSYLHSFFFHNCDNVLVNLLLKSCPKILSNFKQRSHVICDEIIKHRGQSPISQSHFCGEILKHSSHVICC